MDFEDFDFNDPEIAELIEARADELGCSPEEIKAVLKEASDLPRWFDPDFLKNLTGMKKFASSIPWDYVEVARQRMIKEDPSKANWTKRDALIKLIRDQIQREKALLPEKKRLETLFEKDVEEDDH